MSGGFFAAAIGEGVTEPTGGIAMLWAGVAVLTLAMLTVGGGLIRAIRHFHDGQTDGLPMADVVDALVDAVEAARPKPVLRVGRGAKVLPWLRALMPEPVLRSHLARSFGL